MKLFKKLITIVIILMLGALAFSCNIPTFEDRYETVKELYPNAVILSNPDSDNIWVVIDTTGSEDLYYVMQQNWATMTSISELRRLYAYPLTVK
jgi:hypothetical protein